MHYDYGPEMVGPQDLGRHRVFHLENGNKIHIKAEDPYGFWRINLDKGNLPEKLKGMYTSVEMARKDVERYLAEKGRGELKG